MILKIKDSVKGIFILSPYIIEPNKEDMMRKRIDEYIEICKKLAEKENLPAVIRSFIVEHHGAGKAKYFYNTYRNAHPDEEIDDSLFTYPGPNPQTKETSILMMADAVEAASRSLTDHSAESIANLVNRLIDSQIADGLHDDSQLSFKDVKEIKESFIARLRTIYHSRVAYPNAVKKGQSEKA